MASKTQAQLKSITEFDGHPIQLEDATILHVAPLSRELLMVSVGTYNNQTSLDIRRFYLTDNEEWKPGPRGVKIPTKQVEAFLDALTEHRADILKLCRS